MCTAIIATLLPAYPSIAAEQLYDLYYVDENTQIVEFPEVKFKSIGIYVGSTPCAIDSSGKVWVQNEVNEKPHIESLAATNECVSTVSNNHLLPYHSEIWSAGVRRQISTYLGIDADGYLWMQDRIHRDYEPSTTAPNYGQTPIRLTVRFLSGETTGPLSVTKEKPVFLLGQDRSPASVTINQMPTTGAPTGLSTAGLFAVGIGLIGVAFTLMRRLN